MAVDLVVHVRTALLIGDTSASAIIDMSRPKATISSRTRLQSRRKSRSWTRGGGGMAAQRKEKDTKLEVNLEV